MTKVEEGHEGSSSENAGALRGSANRLVGARPVLIEDGKFAHGGQPPSLVTARGAEEEALPAEASGQDAAPPDLLAEPLTIDPAETMGETLGEEQTAVAIEPSQSSVGEVLADRYRLDEHINDDPAGRQVWRGMDVILRRPVAMVLRHPGGDASLEMLSAAVTASRVIHPHLAGVYDAVDEGVRAYVVREWIEGQSLRQLLAETPLDPHRAAMITYAIADACAAVHATGVAHGNVHPGSVLMGDEGRVVLADARVTDATSQEQDVRALGAVLYSSLTGHWPHEIEGSLLLPDAVRVEDWKIASPRQVRAGVPTELDELCMRVLDPSQVSPSAAELAAELSRFGPTPLDSLLGPDNPLRTSQANPASVQTRRLRARWGLAIAGALILVLTGALVALNLHTDNGGSHQTSSGASGALPGPTTQPTPLKLTPHQVRIVDTPESDRDELAGAEKIIDGKLDTGWHPHWYVGDPVFGGYKSGMGVLVNLGKKYNVSSVEVQFDRPGATVDLRTGTEDPGSSAAGDSKIVNSYQTVQGAIENAATRALFSGKEDVQYLLVWISKLPPIGDNKYQVGVQDITVRVHREGS